MMGHFFLLVMAFVLLGGVRVHAVDFYLKDPQIPKGFELKNADSAKQGIEDMPPTLSQDSFGLCYGFSAATLLNYWNCMAVKKSDPTYKCSSMSEKERFSPIGISRYSGESENGGRRDKYYDELLPEGSPITVLKTVTEKTKKAASEECASLDVFLAKKKDKKEQEEVWKELEASYADIRKRSANCPTCLSDTYATAKEEKVRKDFNVPADDDGNRVLQSFSKETYGKALNQLMYPLKCGEEEQSVKLKTPMSVVNFPEKKLDEKKGFEVTMDKIMEKLDQKIPMILSFCAGAPPTEKCSEKVRGVDGSSIEKGMGHGLVITKYRKYCKGSDTKNCYFTVKVQNSYGKSWQENNNDGWVDARSILDASFYDAKSLTWLEEK
jgi:hypothetical protein